MIFVQIASYRDPQLIPTVEDCIAKAKHPENLSFGIAWQHGPHELLGPILNHKRVQVIDIPHTGSKGACWARSLINSILYSGEDYTLMIDSHHRFAQDWDQTLIDMLESLPGKPVLTTYAPSFDPETDDKVDNPWIMKFDPGHSLDFPLFRPAYSDHEAPMLTYCFSAHFAFARGQFILDVPYDPNLYFHGEEITMAVRAFTHGYDLYHPHKVVLWHEYTRKNRQKHWDDDKDWWQMDTRAKERVRSILAGDIPDQIGHVRTIQEYFTLSGHNVPKRSSA
jgi:hypothetical protein